jgi:hypothetical protein
VQKYNKLERKRTTAAVGRTAAPGEASEPRALRPTPGVGAEAGAEAGVGVPLTGTEDTKNVGLAGRAGEGATGAGEAAAGAALGVER